jgi:hypothetical protein
MQVSIVSPAFSPSPIDLVINGGAKHSPDIKSPTRRSYHSRSSYGAGGKKHKKHWSSGRKLEGKNFGYSFKLGKRLEGKNFGYSFSFKLGKSSFRRSGLNKLPIEHEFTPEMKRVIKRYQSDKSKRGKIIWQTIEDDIHNIKSMKDLYTLVKSGSDSYDDLLHVYSKHAQV